MKKPSTVHGFHCCKEHGCKYGDADCPVWQGTEEQAYPCETCAWAVEETNRLLHEIFDFDMGGIVSKTFYDGLAERGLKLVKVDD